MDLNEKNASTTKNLDLADLNMFYLILVWHD